jgi:hypothetical protein
MLVSSLVILFEMRSLDSGKARWVFRAEPACTDCWASPSLVGYVVVAYLVGHLIAAFSCPSLSYI